MIPYPLSEQILNKLFIKFFGKWLNAVYQGAKNNDNTSIWGKKFYWQRCCPFVFVISPAFKFCFPG